MPKFAANLTMLYADSPFLARFGRAKGSGFRFSRKAPMALC